MINIISSLIIRNQLVNVILKHSFFEVAGYSDHIDESLHVLWLSSCLITVWFSIQTVNRMFHLQVFELLSDVVEVFLVTH